jgi:hypothetical protein
VVTSFATQGQRKVICKLTMEELAYYISQTDPWFEEKYSKIWFHSDEVCLEECIATIQFQSTRRHLFSPPSEETIADHPLSKIGLKSFGIYEISNSSWLNELNKALSVSAIAL